MWLEIQQQSQVKTCLELSEDYGVSHEAIRRVLNAVSGKEREPQQSDAEEKGIVVNRRPDGLFLRSVITKLELRVILFRNKKLQDNSKKEAIICPGLWKYSCISVSKGKQQFTSHKSCESYALFSVTYLLHFGDKHEH
ncbi:MAG: hypothetical protein JSW38_02990, partial [Dehalococcoidia bacterium]